MLLYDHQSVCGGGKNDESKVKTMVVDGVHAVADDTTSLECR